MAQWDKTFGGSSPGINTAQFFSSSLTPGAMAASIGMQELNFTALPNQQALATTDLVFVMAPPGATQANVTPVAARVTGANAVTVIYANLTAAANVPTAGVYGFLAIRP